MKNSDVSEMLDRTIRSATIRLDAQISSTDQQLFFRLHSLPLLRSSTLRFLFRLTLVMDSPTIRWTFQRRKKGGKERSGSASERDLAVGSRTSVCLPRSLPYRVDRRSRILSNLIKIYILIIDHPPLIVILSRSSNLVLLCEIVVEWHFWWR